MEKKRLSDLQHIISHHIQSELNIIQRNIHLRIYFSPILDFESTIENVAYYSENLEVFRRPFLFSFHSHSLFVTEALKLHDASISLYHLISILSSFNAYSFFQYSHRLVHSTSQLQFRRFNNQHLIRKVSEASVCLKSNLLKVY